MLAFLLGLTMAAHASLDMALKYTYELDAQNRPHAQIFHRPAPRFSDLEKNQAQYKTYEDFLDYLSLKYPELFDHAVLVHQSQSMQKASLEHPRVILFDGGAAFAFSDHPDQRGRRVEMLETDPGTYEMHFREIVFPPAGPVSFNAAPKTCIACHGSPARPIWNPYDFWPNTFGANVGAAITAEEKQALQNVLTKAPSRGIIRHVKDVTQQPASGLEALTQYLQMLNIGRWVQTQFPVKVEEAPHAYALAYIFSGCTFNAADGYSEDKLKELLPPALQSSFKISYADLLKDSDESYVAFREVLSRQYQSSFPNARQVFPPDHNRLRQSNVRLVAQIRWVLENLGKDWRGTSVGLNKNDYFITTPTLFLFDIMTAVYDLRPQYLDGLQPSALGLGAGSNHWVKFNCQALKNKSLQALQNVSPVAPQTLVPFYEPTPQNSPIARCAKCHGENADGRAHNTATAPTIPFDQPTLLAEWLKKDNSKGFTMVLDRLGRTDSKQMPPVQALSVDEKQAMQEYLKTLLGN